MPETTPQRIGLLKTTPSMTMALTTWPWATVKRRYLPWLGQCSLVDLWHNGQGTVIRNNTGQWHFDGLQSGDAYYSDQKYARI